MYLTDIGEQEPQIRSVPEFNHSDQVLADMRWLPLSEIPERDRA